ncbi:MAG: DUF1854 domain-containing protein [Clostridia bacterium]|nr:DUF1854 domain-containing protein [Clostridia bacterium]
MGRIYVDHYNGRLERTDVYLVRLILRDGTVIENLEPRRLFPFSNTKMFITLLDEHEKEIAFVRDYEELDESSRHALDECFAEYYMIPQISQLIKSEEKFGSLKWTVQTDRGVVTFRIRNRHSDIKQLHGSGRIIIRDSNDNRYEIPSFDVLDSHSKRILFSYL